MIADSPGKGFDEQFKAFKSHLGTVDAKTKAVILSAVAKLTKYDESLKDQVNSVLANYETYWDEDI